MPAEAAVRALAPHDARLVQQMGWAGIKNGRLLALAAPAFDAFVTIDQKLEHQQNLNTLPVAVVVLRARSNRYVDLTPLVPELMLALSNLSHDRSHTSDQFHDVRRTGRKALAFGLRFSLR